MDRIGQALSSANNAGLHIERQRARSDGRRTPRRLLHPWVASLMLMLFGTGGFIVDDAVLEPRAASAGSHYGIRGRQAPELDLDTWIDREGAKTAPIQLSAYRGKVIYLYFFQDW